MNAATHSSSVNLLIVTGIFPPDIGGPATYVPRIAGELANRGHRVTVVTLSDGVDHDEESYPFAVVRIRRALFKPWRVLLTVAAIRRQGRDAAVIYANGLFLEALIANVFCRKPLVQKVVGDWAWECATRKGWTTDSFDEFQDRRPGFKIALLKMLRSLWVRSANTVIVPSQYLAEAVSRWGAPRDRIAVIYNAAELPPSTCSTVPLSTRFNVVTVGRLVPWKRIDRLIQTLQECPVAGLVIIGDGPERERLERLAGDCGVAERIHFAGRKNAEETFGLMAACDVFVLNSTYEGFPHVVLEAMCAGLPVVATAVGGTPELVHHGENGILIAPNGHGTLANNLLMLANSSAERRRLAAGARRTARRFQPSAMVRETEAVLRLRARDRSSTSVSVRNGLLQKGFFSK